MIEFHELAVAEARGAQAWYAERSTRAAQRFQLQLGKAVVRIVAGPERFPRLKGSYRYARVFAFPYILIFRIKEDGIPLVVALAHTSRQSGYWSDRD